MSQINTDESGRLGRSFISGTNVAAVAAAIVMAMVPAVLAILGDGAVASATPQVSLAAAGDRPLSPDRDLGLGGKVNPDLEACCLPDGFCVIVPVGIEVCVEVLEGVPQGAGTICQFAGCSASCCFPETGDCLEDIGFGDCEDMGGLFGGFGSDCEPNPCGDLTGACCLPDGTCVPDVSENLCQLTFAGRFLGPDSVCEDGTCCGGDVTADGVTNFDDLVQVLSAWGACPPIVDCPIDLDDDGIVGFTDITFVLSFFGCR
ncbi:MAG: hypothetical protein AB8G96_02210 [Phycisphaerales bacterium]